MLVAAALVSGLVLASAGAAAVGIEAVVVPLGVALITGGPAWLAVKRGNASQVAMLDKIDTKLDEFIVWKEVHQETHRFLWPTATGYRAAEIGESGKVDRARAEHDRLFRPGDAADPGASA